MPKIPQTKYKLDILDFGRKLLELNDLDPVYVMLHEAELPKETLQRWLLAYWCFYHSGTASYITDQKAMYWLAMEIAAVSKDYLRCPERRHFRGNNAINSVVDLKLLSVNDRFEQLLQSDLWMISAADVMARVKQWVGFGPWIAFKVADMLERLNLARVQFDVSTVEIFDSPKEGAERLWDTLNPGVFKPTHPVKWAHEYIFEGLGTTYAPPRYERGLGIQETETILCKYNSYMKGQYKVGEDIDSLKKSLKVHYNTGEIGMSLSRLAQQIWPEETYAQDHI